MSLLDDLKKKAEVLQVQEQQRSEQALQNIASVDAMLKKIFKYLDELAKTLSVIKPKVEKSYVLSTYGKFEGLQQSDHFSDYRLCDIGNKDYYNTVSFSFKSTSSQTLPISFDEVLLAERFEKLLWEYNIPFKRDDVLNKERQIAKVHYKVPFEVRSELLLQGMHDQGIIQITCKNIGRFGQDELLFTANDIDETWFDELAKFIMADATSRFKQLDKRRENTNVKQSVEVPVPQYEIHEVAEEVEKPKGEKLISTVKGLWGIWKK